VVLAINDISLLTLQHPTTQPPNQLVRRIPHAIVDISTLIPPVLWKRYTFPAGSKETECHDENDNLSTSIQSRTQHVIELQEPFRFVSAQVKLWPERNKKECHDCGVDTGNQPTDVPGDDSNVQIVEAYFGK